MIVNQAVAYSIMTNSLWFAAVISLTAFMGVWGLINFTLTPMKRYFLLIVLGICIAVMTVFSQFNYPPTLVSYFNNSLIYFTTHYLLIRQVIEYFISANSRLTKYQPLYGIIVLTFIGSMESNSSQSLVFLLCSIGFIISASLFTAFSWTPDANNRLNLRLPVSRTLVSIVLFSVVAGVTWLSGMFLINIEENANKFMFSFNLPVSTGFSNRAKLGSLAYKKSNSEKKVILRVFADRNPGYLRAKAYNVYKSPIWKIRSRTTTILPDTRKMKNVSSIEKDQDVFVLKESETDDWFTANVWSAYSSQQVMFTPLETKIIAASLTELQIDESEIVVSKGQKKKTNYRTFSTLGNSPLPTPDINKEQFIEIPKNLHPDVISLSGEVFKGCNDTISKISAVEQYFNTEYKYKLGIQVPENTDPLTYFLMEKPPAHCEYFATGAAVLLRLAGVPCRYVTGFVLAEWNPLGEYWIARNRDANAWVEVYDDKKGWLIVEATPSGGVPSTFSNAKTTYIWDYVKHCFRVFLASLSMDALKSLLSKCISFFTGMLHPLVYLFIVGDGQ